jgi:hypothetical protein
MAVAITPAPEKSAALVRADVLVLLREKRYEEALARLYQARAETPDSVELQKSLEQVKEFLVGAYAKRLGGLDQIPQPIPPVTGRTPDVILLSRFIDGVSSYGDLAEICPLGRMRTLQVLIEMYAPPAADAPQSARRPLELSAEPPQPVTVLVPAPGEEARPAVAEDPDTRRYREAFASGTAAFVQHRFADAVAAFELCAELRPGDAATEVLLRRARRDLESR